MRAVRSSAAAGNNPKPPVGPSHPVVPGAAGQLAAKVKAEHKRGLITSIEFTLDRPFAEFDEGKFKIAFKLATGIDASQIRIASIRSGSTIVQIDGEQETLAIIIQKIQSSQQVAHQLAQQTGMRKISWEIDGARYELTVDEPSNAELPASRPAIVRDTPQKVQFGFAVGFGIAGLAVILTIAIFIPVPTVFQYQVFRIILALAAGGVASMIPGILSLQIPNFLTAGGALAVFAIIYFYSPAQLAVRGISPDPTPTPTATSTPTPTPTAPWVNQELYHSGIEAFNKADWITALKDLSAFRTANQQLLTGRLSPDREQFKKALDQAISHCLRGPGGQHR